jgi:hypothetical protein
MRSVFDTSLGINKSTSLVARTDPWRFAATPPAIRYFARWAFSSRQTRTTRLPVPGIPLATTPLLQLLE